MDKILVTLVGRQDPLNKDGKDGPVLTLLKNTVSHNRYLKPDIIYLLPTAAKPGNDNNTEENAVKTKQAIESMGGYVPSMVIIKPLPFNNMDYGEIQHNLYELLNAIRKDNSSAEYYVHLGPGIPAVVDVLINAIVGKYFRANAIRVIEERFLPKFSDGSPDYKSQIIDVDLFPFREDSMITKALGLFADGFFRACADIFTEVGSSTRSRSREAYCSIFASLADAYYRWDIMKYSDALSVLKKVKDQVKNSGQEKLLLDMIKLQTEKLERIENKDERFYCIDLYHNAERRLKQGYLSDAIWRCIAIYETILSIKFLSLTGINPNNFDKEYKNAKNKRSILPEKSAVLDAFIETNKSRWLGYLTKSDLVKLIEELDKGFFKKGNYGDLREFFDNLGKKRNDILHDMREANNKDAEKGLEKTGELLKKFYPNSNIEDYPFSAENIKKAGEEILKPLIS